MSNRNTLGSELQGLTRMLTDATLGITDLVEAMHRQVVHPPLLPSTPIQHLITRIAGFTYRGVRGGTKIIGGGLDQAFGYLAPVLGERVPTVKKKAIRAVLNGIVGDYLEEQANPLQVRMEFRHQSGPVALDPQHLAQAYPSINGKILLLVHGSCMNDQQWTRNAHNHGLALAKDLDKTPLYLHYNSGRHISANGQDLSTLLAELVAQWPVPVEELVILAHSMGGLVVRSALHYGQQQEQAWTQHLQQMIFLGTPHHGAPLERIGNYLDVILEAIPYARPFARLGKIRSAGVTDLRYGNLVEADWQDTDRFEIQGDRRRHCPLPEQVECYSVAAVTKPATDTPPSRLVGDGLVTVRSALGQHRQSARTLHFQKENTWVAYETTHLDLLSSPQVYAKLKEWVSRRGKKR